MATPAAINFMAWHGRGLICLALEARRAAELGLELQHRSTSSRGELFTVSIEARDGVTTGISAHDRARTIGVAIAANGPECLHSPGHVFPIVASDGGVLARRGYAEAAVDIARLAGLNSSGVICTILAPDGDVADPAQVARLAAEYDFKIGALSDLVAYRCAHEPHVRYAGTAPLATNIPGAWQLHTFRNALDGSETIALQCGQRAPGRPFLAYLGTVSILSHVPGPGDAEAGRLRDFMNQAARRDGGVIILQQQGQFDGDSFAAGNRPLAEAQASMAAQMLLQLGVTQVEIVGARHGVCEAMVELGVAARVRDLSSVSALNVPALASGGAQ